MNEKRNFIWDDRAPAYLKSGDLAAAIAKQHHRLDIDSITHERWRQLMALMREVDTWADDTGVSAQEVHAGLESFDDFMDLYPALAPQSLGAEAQDRLLRRTDKILKLGSYIADTTSVSRFIILRIAEARESVNLFEDTATQYVREQPEFESGFMPTLRSLGQAATLWDSVIDGWHDTKAGKQSLKLTPEYYIKTTAAMLQQGKLGGKALLHSGPFLHLGIKGALRVVNRIQHGIPDYSNMRLFERKPGAKQ